MLFLLYLLLPGEGNKLGKGFSRRVEEKGSLACSLYFRSPTSVMHNGDRYDSLPLANCVVKLGYNRPLYIGTGMHFTQKWREDTASSYSEVPSYAHCLNVNVI
jgi:hypothetical protein